MATTEKEKMLAGDLYIASDPELLADYARAQGVLARFNATPGDDLSALRSHLSALLGFLGDGAIVKPALGCDYGFNIRIGARTFLNYDCCLLDCSTITIGDEVQMGPGVHIYTATHPLDAATRRSGLESLCLLSLVTACGSVAGPLSVPG
jgi:maltose O-acetyltransferase